MTKEKRKEQKDSPKNSQAAIQHIPKNTNTCNQLQGQHCWLPKQIPSAFLDKMLVKHFQTSW